MLFTPYSGSVTMGTHGHHLHLTLISVQFTHTPEYTALLPCDLADQRPALTGKMQVMLPNKVASVRPGPARPSLVSPPFISSLDAIKS